jgi:short-subunit dehydrogenase
MQTLTGKVAWVTGAGTGIGEAGAAALAEAGMTVVLSGRRAAPLEAVAQRLNATAAGKARVEAADLSQ